MDLPQLKSRRFAQLMLGAALLALAACASVAPAGADRADAASARAREQLELVVASPHRSAANRARDAYRHPVQTLMFFGIRPEMTVVELWPFGGWYAEILAPYLRDAGVYYAAAMDPDSTDPQDKSYNDSLSRLFTAHPELFGRARVSVLARGKMEIAPAGSADLVLTFRNVHNWAWAGIEKEVFAAAFRALKPGGVLGVVEHRHSDPDYEPKTPGQAYVGEDYTVRLAESVGFRLAARSDINRNPKDTKDYPQGVWTLPPTWALGEQDRAKYAAIGESDRFTLKFTKP